MQKLLTVWLDLIFPPTANEKILRQISNITAEQLFRPENYKNITYLSAYSNPIIKSSIIENKFNHHPRAAHLLGNLLIVWLKNNSMRKTLFIPIPLGPKRQRERGHNQVTTILKNCPTTLTINTKLLQRNRETAAQAQLPKKQREQNIKAAFVCIDTNFDYSSYQQIIIIDDVVTTGATLSAAHNILVQHLPSHIKLSCLAIAH